MKFLKKQCELLSNAQCRTSVVSAGWKASCWRE